MGRKIQIILIILFIILFSCSFFDKNNTENTKLSPVIDPAKYQNIIDLENNLKSISDNETSSVVSISTEKTISRPYSYFNPFDFFFGQPWGQNTPNDRRKEYKQSGLGSGVIYKKVNNTYYIVTNNHVVDGVDSIKVSIEENKIYNADIVGNDPEVDLAIVKIKTKDNLDVALFGDSNKIDIGDFAIAIGNPYGLQGTMTFGIISAVNRGNLQTGKVSLTDFIQTDAAINPGNSGGALINLKGEVIGINTLIYSQSGGNVGIGFAIPSNVVKSTAEQIIKTGKVDHGWLGIGFEVLDKEKIEILNLKGINYGIHILNVINKSPADKAGLETGDVILELSGKKLKDSDDLVYTIANLKPGTKVKLKIFKEGKEEIVEVVLGNRSDMKKAIVKDNEVLEEYGLKLSEITNEIKNRFNIPAKLNGVLIVSVSYDGRARRVGLQIGDVIYKVNNISINSIKEIKKVLEDNKNLNYFYIYRNGRYFIVKM